jgi:uncharacterized membrane protein YedE/YeeE
MNVPRVVTAFLAGVLFAIGLGVAGMCQPSKVIAFLDVAGHWDPSLGFVMVGAIGVYFVAFRLITRRERPVFNTGFDLPAATALTPRLLGGAALFGLGWGASGFCPGPAITSMVGSGAKNAVLFVLAMAAGSYLSRRATSGLPENVTAAGA